MKDKTFKGIGIFVIISLALFCISLLVNGLIYRWGYIVPEWLGVILLIFYFPGGILTWLMAIILSS